MLWGICELIINRIKEKTNAIKQWECLGWPNFYFLTLDWNFSNFLSFPFLPKISHYSWTVSSRHIVMEPRYFLKPYLVYSFMAWINRALDPQVEELKQLQGFISSTGRLIPSESILALKVVVMHIPMTCCMQKLAEKRKLKDSRNQNTIEVERSNKIIGWIYFLKKWVIFHSENLGMKIPIVCVAN